MAATGIGQALGDGRTTATITVAGVEVGTTAAAFTVTGVDGDVASLSDPIVFTGRGGRLTAEVTCTLDLAPGPSPPPRPASWAPARSHSSRGA